MKIALEIDDLDALAVYRELAKRLDWFGGDPEAEADYLPDLGARQVDGLLAFCGALEAALVQSGRIPARETYNPNNQPYRGGYSYAAGNPD